jgi:hypothetical protein
MKSWIGSWIKPWVSLGLGGALGGGLVFLGAPPAQACTFELGADAEGVSLAVDMCSIARVTPDAVDFVYVRQRQRITSQASCRVGIWTTFPDRENHKPSDSATRDMLDAVCRRGLGQAQRGRLASVTSAKISPIRQSPGGTILCNVRPQSEIRVYEVLPVGRRNFYYTDYCNGQVGVIPEADVDIYYNRSARNETNVMR